MYHSQIFLSVCQCASNYQAKSETYFQGLRIGPVSVSSIASCCIMSPKNESPEAKKIFSTHMSVLEQLGEYLPASGILMFILNLESLGGKRLKSCPQGSTQEHSSDIYIDIYR